MKKRYSFMKNNTYIFFKTIIFKCLYGFFDILEFCTVC